MGGWRRRCVTVLMVVVVVTGFIGADAGSQTMARVRGEVTDQWGNALEGVRVIGRRGDAEPRETTTTDAGRFNLTNLPSGEYVIEFRAVGYQPTGVEMTIMQRDARFPLEIELAAFPPGSRIRNDTEFGTEDGTLTLTLKDDGKFEFKDGEGDGEGTYGIVELEGFLTVRDYDGDDDTFSITEPVVVTFANDLLTSLTWGDATLRKK